MSTEWDDSTPIDSLVAMRHAINKNTRQVGAAVEYAQKTYELVKPFADRMQAIELEQRAFRRDRLLMAVVALASVILSGVGLACEAIR